MGIDDAINFEDLRLLAKRRLPKICYDFIEGGADDEIGLDRNQQAFRDLPLIPRYLVNVDKRDLTKELFGRKYDLPYGISPTGLAGMFRVGGDMMLAQAARDANIPFVMSGSSTASIEDLGKLAPEHGWYQLYAARDKSVSEDMIRRADAAGLGALVLTVDVPVHSNRERNARNRFGRPLRLSLATKLDALSYPGWLYEYLKGGLPMFPNWLPYAGEGADADEVADFMASMTTPPLTWDDVARFREIWPRKFILKGIMHPDDAIKAAELGCDGIVVSNHGARQLDRAPASIEVLPAIAAAVGNRMTIMLDSGIRRGSDIATALCLGADFVFVGRATLYGVTAGGTAGATKAIEILRRELDLVMGQIGVADLASLNESFIFKG